MLYLRDVLNMDLSPSYHLRSFEALLLKSHCIDCVLFIIHHPPQCFLSSLILCHDKILIAGDLNIHIDDISPSEFLKSFYISQHVSGPTHECRDTLYFRSGVIVFGLKGYFDV